MAEAESQLSMAIMDYAPIVGAFSGKIVVKVMSQPEICKAIDAFNLFQKHIAYPHGYRNMLESALHAPLLAESADINAETLS